MATPSDKSPQMEEAIEALAREQYGRGWRESIEADVCVDCGGAATEFRDQVSEKEFTISGFCQKCQDKVWG